MQRAKPILLAVYVTGLLLLLLVGWVHRALETGGWMPVFSLVLLLGFLPALSIGSLVGVGFAVVDLVAHPALRTAKNYLVPTAGVLALPVLAWSACLLVRLT